MERIIRRCANWTARARSFGTKVPQDDDCNSGRNSVLGLTVVENLKVFLFQIADCPSLRIADQYRHQRHIDFALDREGASLFRGFFRLRHRHGRGIEQ